MTAAQPARRVLIVDDDPLVRAGLTALFSGAPGILVVGTAADGRSAADAALQIGADAVLMDVQMPGVNGLAAVALLRARVPGIRVVLMSNTSVAQLIPHAKAVGADAVMAKTASIASLAAAIRGAADGAAGHEVGEPTLSPRELEVAVQISRGIGNEAIAAQLEVSANTVKTYVHRLFRKFGADNRVQLANAIKRSGLPGPDDGAVTGGR